MEIADLSLVFQDHHLLIVNKPAGVVIHPTYKHANNTMWDALLAYTQLQGLDDWQPPALPDDLEWAGAPDTIRTMLRAKRIERLWKEDGQLPRPCLLHRLDKDTSGIVVLARTENARRYLVKQFHDHSLSKRYLAVIHQGAYPWSAPRAPFGVHKQSLDGRILVSDIPFLFQPSQDEEYLLDGALQRDPDDRRRCIVGPDGQVSRTLVRILAVEHGYALIDVHPITGRTHQIRAHLAALGYAIVGDQLYAPEVQPARIPTLTRQFLHAYSLTFRRYPDNQSVTYRAPLADDLLIWLEQTSPILWRAWLDLSTLPI